MMMELEYRVAELERRLRSMIATGTIEELDETEARVRVTTGGRTTTWLPWLTQRAGSDREWWAPESGEQVLLLCPDGDLALGIVLPAIYRDAFPPPASEKGVHRTVYEDGAVTEYNRVSHTLKADIPGAVDLTCSGDATIKAEGTVTLTGVGGVQIDGAGGQNCRGTVNGFSLCPFTGTPHVQVSKSVTSSE